MLLVRDESGTAALVLAGNVRENGSGFNVNLLCGLSFNLSCRGGIILIFFFQRLKQDKPVEN